LSHIGTFSINNTLYAINITA